MGFVLKVPEVVRGGNGKPQMRLKELTLAFHDNGLVRWAKRPPKVNDKGKKVEYTDKEMRELKSPPGAPGYAAEREDLQPGSQIEVQLLRPKNIAADKLPTLVETDFKVKYAVLLDDPAKRETSKKKRAEEKVTARRAARVARPVGSFCPSTPHGGHICTA